MSYLIICPKLLHNKCQPDSSQSLLRQSADDGAMSSLRDLPGLSSSSLGLGQAVAKAAPSTPGVEKPAKKVNHQKLVSGKIAAMTTKATDCMAWTSKVTDATSL